MTNWLCWLISWYLRVTTHRRSKNTPVRKLTSHFFFLLVIGFSMYNFWGWIQRKALKYIQIVYDIILEFQGPAKKKIWKVRFLTGMKNQAFFSCFWYFYIISYKKEYTEITFMKYKDKILHIKIHFLLWIY